MNGYSGELVTSDPRTGHETAGALSIVYDATSAEGHPALVGFIGGDQATQWAQQTVNMELVLLVGLHLM